jgi:hypothetical protein
MVKVTALPDEPPDATSVMGETPTFTGEAGAVKLMVCEARVAPTVTAAEVAEA